MRIQTRIMFCPVPLLRPPRLRSLSSLDRRNSSCAACNCASERDGGTTGVGSVVGAGIGSLRISQFFAIFWGDFNDIN